MAPRTPRIEPHDARVKLIELAEAYADPSRPFFPVPARPQLTLSAQGDGPLGTQIVDLRWPSEYEPFLPAARELYLRFEKNHTAHARWWTSGRGRPTIVLLHGWGGGNHWVTQRAFDVPYWLRHGYDVAAFVLPYHGDRAPSSKSGAVFPSPNPMRTNEGFGQAVFDLRGLALELRARGSTAIGAIGMSLGGYTTAVWASVAGPADPGGLDFAVAMIPAVDMAKLMWRHGDQSPERKRAMQAGITEDLLVDAFAVHAPLMRPVRLPAERLAVIAGRGDRITGPEQAADLAAHWGVPVEWFDGGHLAQIGRGDAVRTVRQKLGALELPGRRFRS